MGDRIRGSKRDAGKTGAGGFAARRFDPASCCRTAVLVGLIGLLTVWSAWATGARSTDAQAVMPAERATPGPTRVSAVPESGSLGG